MTQTSLLEPDPGPLSPAKVSFLEGLLATFAAIADGRSTASADDRRRGRAAAEAALVELGRVR